MFTSRHSTKQWGWEDGLHPEDLYKKIGSSLDAAIEADEALAD